MFIDDVYQNEDRKYARLGQIIKLRQDANERMLKGENVDWTKIPAVSARDEEDYKEYEVSKALFTTTASKALYLLEFDGKDVSHLPIEEKIEMAKITNQNKEKGSLADVIKGADVFIGVSAPGTLTQDMVKTMAKDPIIFACANPTPEIFPDEAKAAGAAVVSTGRSDFPNQVNNSMGFPAIFRGVLDVRARTITDDMCIAAATELAKCAEEKGITEDYIVPNMSEEDVFPREAAAVAMAAQKAGVARLSTTYEEEYERAAAIISRSRKLTGNMMDQGFIKPYVE